MLLDEFKIVEVAAIVLRDAQGRVLSVRKGSSPRFQMPGGKLEAHETPLEAALREVREEVGLDLKNAAIRPLGDFSAPASNEPGFTVVSHVFIAEGVFSPQQVRPHAEIAEVDWFDPSAPTTRPQAPLQAKIFCCSSPAVNPRSIHSVVIHNCQADALITAGEALSTAGGFCVKRAVDLVDNLKTAFCQEFSPPGDIYVDNSQACKSTDLSTTVE